MKVQMASEKHEITYQELAELLRKRGDIDALELLAVASNMIGKIIAMQDQRKVNKEMCLQLVAANIEVGNKQVVDILTKTVGNG